MFEQFRSDYDGHRGGEPAYQNANYGSKSDAARRHNYETLQGDFQTLAARPDILIKIRERLRKLFSRDVSIVWDGGTLKIEFVRTSGSISYSSAREASGLLQLAGILAALYDDEVGALLIDEPEVSLHPQLQAFLLKEILGVAGDPTAGSNKKLIVIGTHSTEFLKIDSPKDIPRLVFCYDLGREPIQVSPDADELKSTKLAALLARIGQEHKLAFFANSPLLVEGPSDSIICSSLASKLDIHIEAGGSQLLPVIGKGEFPAVVKLLRMTGKTPFVLADADAFADGMNLINTYLHNDDANSRAAEAGSGSGTELSRSIYTAFCELVKEHWAEIAVHAEKHAYWLSRDKSEDGQIKAMRRAAFATLFCLPEEEVASIGAEGKWEKIRKRISFLLDLLETQGCFILRRGTIESYYIGESTALSLDKPGYAAAEAASFVERLKESLEAQYADVLRCLRRAARTQPIVEAEALQDALLAVAAPALARIRTGAASDSLNALAKGMVGDIARLFELSSDEGKLRISLTSQILDVRGFPLDISTEDDVVRVVGRALGIGGS